MNTEENNDEIVMDDEAEPKDALKKLREKLKVAVEEKQDYLNRLQRAQADFVNARKRDDESKAEFLKFANEDLVMEILPVLDSFEMAMANKEAWEKAEKNWRVGVEYIYAQLKSALEKNGLSEQNPMGQKLDPLRDTAIEVIPVNKKEEDGIILAVLQKGYLLNGKLIRSPRVKVGTFNN